MRYICYKIISHDLHRIQLPCHKIKIVNGRPDFINTALIINLRAVISSGNLPGSAAHLFQRMEDIPHQKEGNHIPKQKTEKSDQNKCDGDRNSYRADRYPISGQKI